MKFVAIAGFALIIGIIKAVPVTQCPSQSFIPHGTINCTDGNNTGSMCSYQCDALPYSIYPIGRDSSVCQANGTWSQELPCCARPCPPYVVFDWVSLFNFKSASVMMPLIMDELTKNTILADDSVQYGALYFNENPVVSSVVDFNDYDHNLTTFYDLIDIRMSQLFTTSNGPSNAGAAVKYAMENMFKESKGARHDAPKAVCIITDNYSDDDVVVAAKEARKEGFLVYVYAFNRPGLTFDRQLLETITGDSDHVFIFDNDVTLATKYLEDMAKHFCKDPCNHVVHDHDHEDHDHDDDDEDDDDDDEDDDDDDDSDDEHDD